MSDTQVIEDKYRALVGRLDEATLRLWAGGGGAGRGCFGCLGGGGGAERGGGRGEHGGEGPRPVANDDLCWFERTRIDDAAVGIIPARCCWEHRQASYPRQRWWTEEIDRQGRNASTRS